MIWVIASIPFWTIATALFFFGTVGLFYGLLSKDVDAEEFGDGLPGISICMIGSAMFAILAAKICS